MSTSPARRRLRFSTVPSVGSTSTAMSGYRLFNCLASISAKARYSPPGSPAASRSEPLVPLRTHPAANAAVAKRNARLLIRVGRLLSIGQSPATGRRKRTRSPPSGAFSTPTVPPWPAAISAAMANPRPVPAPSSFPRQNRADALDRSSSGSPDPSSLTINSAVSSVCRWTP